MGAGKATGSRADTPDLRPPLRPPGTRPDNPVPAKAGYRGVWIALAAVVSLGLLVVLVLPHMVTEPVLTNVEKDSMVHDPIPSAGIDLEQDKNAGRNEAEQALQAFLKVQAELELVNADTWGEPAWSQAARLAASGDRLFGERRFAEAAQDYDRAQDLLKKLEASRTQRFADALSAARQALENDDAELAQEQFELALAIEPGDEQVSRGLDRARARRDVLRLVEEGEQAESEADLETARARYTQALQLDTDYQPASENRVRVEQKIVELTFNAAMSRALVALEAGQLVEAKKALEDAEHLKPGDEALRDARQRLAQRTQQAKLSRLRREASARARVEDWQAATNLYREALSVDANAGFAREGLKQAQDRLRLNKQFDHYLADPGRLYSQEPLANAEQLLATTGVAPRSEPKLAGKIGLLKRQVTAARQPLTVNLRSDGETEVVIYHVGRLGSFLDHQLQLRPGTYTAVGSRPGYRDVRTVFTLSPGQPPVSIEIRCEEPV